jgi:hypothetical protein
MCVAWWEGRQKVEFVGVFVVGRTKVELVCVLVVGSGFQSRRACGEVLGVEREASGDVV